MSLEASARPAPVSGVALATLDGEGVLLGARGAGHLLNPTATILWQCFDGDGSLQEIAVDAAEAFGQPLPAVLDQLTALADDLLGRGLLATDATDDLPLAPLPLAAVSDHALPSAQTETMDLPATATLVVGRRVIGVAAASEALVAPLRERYEAYDGPIQPSRNLVLDDAFGLWRAGDELARFDSAARQVRAAAAWLWAWDADRRTPGCVPIESVAAIDVDGAAIVLPPIVRLKLQPTERAMRRLGLRLVDGPVLDVDPATCTVVVGGLPAAPGAVPDGRYPIRLLVLQNDRGVTPTTASAALALAQISPARGSMPPADLLGAVAAFVDRVPRAGVRMGAEADISRDLARLVWP